MCGNGAKVRNPESSRPAVRARPPAALVDRYRAIRATTMRLVLPLAVEDMVVQSMPDCSPVRWHLAHTTWFFETFVLKEFAREFRPFHPEYERLFNSYYQAVGTPLPRDRRGVLSRPTVSEVREYRAAVDERMGELLETRGETLPEEAIARIALGLEHEQQHQELILTDVKHALAQNPLLPAYRTLDRIEKSLG